ncbi:hypothetical protein A3C86_04305 [Candidatus Kaiserbacteria bacterium RIFCSPHIGHO2_02_FULL_49_16]|uniref:POTRA domain-containing protein n=1 Tax=Candidatus Kaiserbacteria bacterium RIFCSPHIGHO2_02_FULL_49_16 TaxID=1798490 RepID=A0A1F6DBG3_9BACT|nr:MAG: hypothetical protein A3C86_04305 [Candidatus Kaiserbacteria bacterium RIFCSPHIGHO2_02_FULL_49_16]
MSNGERRHGHGIIDLRKRRAGEQARARARAAQASLPLYNRTSLRLRRRKLRAMLALLILIFAAGAIYGISEFSYLPRYSINKITVEGMSSISPRLVKAFVETKLNNGTYSIISRGNIFLYPKTEIAKGISEYFPKILNAQISRESLLARAITVSITERKMFALWCSDKAECFKMDDTGFVFAVATISSAGQIVFSGGLAASTTPIGQTFLPEQFADVLALLSRLKEEGFSATSVSVEDEQDFSVSLSKGFDVRATFSQDANTIARNLQTVLLSESLQGKEDKIEYIDLRFGNRVYYKNRE